MTCATSSSCESIFKEGALTEILRRPPNVVGESTGSLPNLPNGTSDQPALPSSMDGVARDRVAGTSHPGRSLSSSTLEAIRSDLDRQLLYSPEFVARYFPEVAARGSVTLSDVERMNRHQADAMAFSLGRSLRCFAREEERQRVRRALCPPLSAGTPRPGKNTAKAVVYVAALRNLCETYHIEALL